MECCDVKVFVEETKHIFQWVHLSASQVQCNTQQTISKLGLFQGSRIIAFLTILGFTKLSFMQGHNNVMKQILFCQHWGEALSTIHVFTNTHGLIKGCLNEDLILAYVLNKRRGGL